MKKRFRLLFPLCLLSLTLSGCTLDLGFIKIGDDTTQDADVEVDPSVLDAYYKGYDLDKRGGKLALELQKQCFDKHIKWITYGQVNSYFAKTSSHESAEAIAKGSKVNQWFYTGKEASGTGTREHVWPCASSNGLWSHTASPTGGFTPHYVDNNYYVGGGSDLYHIRTCNTDVNTARGNSNFADFSDSEYDEMRKDVVSVGEPNGLYELKLYGATPKGSKYEYARVAEPADEMKGDIARIILYIWVHYSSRGLTLPDTEITPKAGNTFKLTDFVATLSLTSIMGYSSDERCKQELIEWNNLDKPSNVEKLRNETVQKIQGNRNPFVDYPDLVEKLLG